MKKVKEEDVAVKDVSWRIRKSILVLYCWCFKTINYLMINLLNGVGECS